MRGLAVAAAVLMAGAAQAADISGPSALALAGVLADRGVIGLAPGEQYQVAALFEGRETAHFPVGEKIVLRADSVACRVSDVNITARVCQLTRGRRTAKLIGSTANALFATLAAAGVTREGAAGSIVIAIRNLTCTLTPSVIKQNAGGGATCAYSPGP